MFKFKHSKQTLKDGELVVGVCYPPSAENIVKMNGLDSTFPPVIGYLTEVDDRMNAQLPLTAGPGEWEQQ